jgi:hypothetical protein
MYDYIWVNTNGLNNEPYYFMYKPDAIKVSTNKYRYNLRLEHGSVLLKQSQYLFGGVSEFDIFANLDTLVDLIVTNSDRFIAGKFVKGNIAATIRKNHNFKGEDCLSVVKRLAQEYGLEYDIRFVVPGAYYTINIVDQIAATKEITLEYGKGKGLYELSRLPINRDNLVTVLYAYGAAKNLKPDYRGGKRRLEFDGSPLKQNDNLYMGVEKTVFFDDIYPNRTAQITGYYQKLPDELTVPEREVWPGGIYRIEDNTLDFDINDYLLGGLTAKIRIKTGNLAGYEFEIQKYDHDFGYIWIIPFKDETGYILPNSTLMPQAGDEYTLVDIDQPEIYVTIAEAELHVQAQEYLDKWSVPEYPYQAKVHPGYLAGIADRFEVGDRITIKDTDFGIDRLYRISQFVYSKYTGVYELTLSEHRILTRRERQQFAIERIERTLEGTNAQLIENIRKDKETVYELRARVFDPNDDLQAVDRTVRSESIDPRMLAFDAGVPQFSLRNALVEVNYQGDYNKLKIGAGQLVVQNWPEKTLPRYEIKKLRDSGGHYDPTRTWTIPETILTLAGTGGYWLYCRLPLAPGASQATLFVQEDHVEVKLDIDDREIIYKLGHISDQSSPRYAAMLWGNVKYQGNLPEAAVINQPNHGLAKDQAIRHNGTIYVLAQADNDVNAQVCGIVSEVIDAHNFRYVTDGFMAGNWTAGAEYFLSPDVPGLLITLPEPETWSVGQVRISLGWGTTQGLKVEIDVGDLIDELPTVKLTGIWDREFEFCINQGYPEIFTVDYWAVYPYTILELIVGVDNGSLPASSIQVNGIAVGGLENVTIGSKALTMSTGDNEVTEGMEVTLNTSGSFTGDPQVIKGKLKILRK